MRSSSEPLPPTRRSAGRAGDPLRWRSGPAAAAAALAVFWVVLVAGLRNKSPTYDEVAHAAAGYAYWHFGDYRLQPENGQLPQRAAGLPLALSTSPLPAPDPVAWRDSDDWQLGYQWLFRSHRDAASLASGGRMACGLFAVALGALVFAWSRRLFGGAGAMVSLLLFALNPTILANGALMTSDTAAALFFLGSTWALWGVLTRVTPGRVVLSTLLLSGLFLTKVSALLIVPVAALAAVARLVDGRPLDVALGPWARRLSTRGGQALAFAAVALVHAVAAVALIWASYGFRYSAFSDGAGRFRQPWEYLLAKPGPAPLLKAVGLSEAQRGQVQSILVSTGATEAVWTNRTLDAVAAIRQQVLSPEQGQHLYALLARPSPETWVRAVEAVRGHHLLPEAWIYGFTDVYRRSQVRPAFLNGEFRLRGWPWFFPYTFLVKTPLALFAIMALSLGALDWAAFGPFPGRRRALWERLYPTIPLWLLLAVYWAAAVASHLNIGHRHLLPVYPPLFILCGASGTWLKGWLGPAPARGRAMGAVLIALLAALFVETACFFPNYLAYFNGIVTPRAAYRHLVDSSLDWGQELPAIRAYLDHHVGAPGSAYLSYFGTASPDYYGIRARPLFSVAGLDGRDRPDWKTFFIAPEDLQARVPELREQYADCDLLGMQRLGDVVAVTFLRKPEDLGFHAGTYLVSASMLEPVNFSLQGPWGPWNEHYEATYQELDEAVRPLENPDRKVRMAALRLHRSGEWPVLLERFEEYRFGRLTAYLRHREPDDLINASVLVYRITEGDLEKALRGPAPELGPDARSAEMGKLPKNGSESLP